MVALGGGSSRKCHWISLEASAEVWRYRRKYPKYTEKSKVLLFDTEGCALESKERPSCAEKNFASVMTSTVQPAQDEERINPNIKKAWKER